MYFSDSIVSDVKVMNCGLMPTFVSCTSCEQSTPDTPTHLLAQFDERRAQWSRRGWRDRREHA